MFFSLILVILANFRKYINEINNIPLPKKLACIIIKTLNYLIFKKFVHTYVKINDKL
jgi:hypothetical protein